MASKENMKVCKNYEYTDKDGKITTNQFCEIVQGPKARDVMKDMTKQGNPKPKDDEKRQHKQLKEKEKKVERRAVKH